MVDIFPYAIHEEGTAEKMVSLVTAQEPDMEPMDNMESIEILEHLDPISSADTTAPSYMVDEQDVATLPLSHHHNHH